MAQFKRKGRDQILPSGNLVQYITHLTQIIHSIQSALKEWETDEVIGYELYRNIGLAMICIFVISLTMLADVKISLMVMACVILTMVMNSVLLIKLIEVVSAN